VGLWRWLQVRADKGTQTHAQGLVHSAPPTPNAHSTQPTQPEQAKLQTYLCAVGRDDSNVGGRQPRINQPMNMPQRCRCFALVAAALVGFWFLAGCRV